MLKNTKTEIKEINLEKIVARAQAKDEKALTILIQRYQGLLYKASSQRHVLTIRQEAYSEAYYRFYEAIMSFDPTRKIPFSGFAKYKVYSGIHTLFRQYLRIWQNEMSYDVKDDTNSDEESYGNLFAIKDDISENAALNIDFNKAFYQLSQRQQTIVREILINGETMTQTAKNLNISVQAVSKNYAKAISFIRENIKPEFYDTDKKDKNKNNNKIRRK